MYIQDVLYVYTGSPRMNGGILFDNCVCHDGGSIMRGIAKSSTQTFIYVW